MLVWALVVLNIPVYLFIGWLAFDTKESAADTFFETIVAVLRIILVPRLLRYLLGWDDADAVGLFPVGGFILACAGIVFFEHMLITKLLLS